MATITVLELINRLEKLAADSPLGDGTVVVLSVTGSPYAHVTDALLETDVTIPGPNGLILLNVDESMLEIEHTPPVTDDEASLIKTCVNFALEYDDECFRDLAPELRMLKRKLDAGCLE